MQRANSATGPNPPDEVGSNSKPPPGRNHVIPQISGRRDEATQKRGAEAHTRPYNSRGLSPDAVSDFWNLAPLSTEGHVSNTTNDHGGPTDNHYNSTTFPIISAGSCVTIINCISNSAANSASNARTCGR